MKKNIILCAIILLIGMQAYAQQISHVPLKVKEEKDYSGYMRTHKTLRTLGWVSLGTGIASGCVGLIAHVESTETGEKADWLIVAGGALVAASIPLFITSHHYKNKAASVSLGNQRVFVPIKGGIKSNLQPAVTFTVRF